MISFSSKCKAMGVIVRLRDGRYWLFLRGASEFLTRLCMQHVVVAKPDESSKNSGDIETRDINAIASDNI